MSGVDVLLVEDQGADAELAVATLRAAMPGAQVRVMGDGVEALDYLTALERAGMPYPRVVLLDIKLPRMDGFDVLRAVKENPRTRAIPVVMLTSSLVERDVARCYLLGANGYVQKPVPFDEFRTTVGSLGAYWLGANAAPPPSAFSPGEDT